MGNVRLGDITDIRYAILTRSWNHRTDRLGVAVRVNSNALVSLVFFKAVANLPSFTPDVAKPRTTEDLIGHPICSTTALISPVRAKHTPAPPDRTLRVAQGTGSDAPNRPLKHLMALPPHDSPRDCENGMPVGPETASRPSKYTCVDA